MKLTAVDVIESYTELIDDVELSDELLEDGIGEDVDDCLSEEMFIVPVKLVKDVLFFKLNDVAYGYKANEGEDARELWRKFVKMVTQYQAGGKAFQWMKKHTTHEFGGKTGRSVPSTL